jgi:hypothetical protein
MNKKEALFLPATLILICIVFIVTMEGGTKRKKKHKKETQEVSENKNSNQNSSLTAFYNAIQTDNEHFPQAEIQNFISMLQDEETNSINTHTGIHSVTSRIENFCKQLVNQSSPDYFNNTLFNTCFEELVKASFPEKQEMINVYYRNLIQYRLVLETENNSSEVKTKSEREDMIWRKRYELFGYAAAEELYAGERYLLNIKQKIIANTSSKKNFDEKINSLQNEIAILKMQRQQDSSGEEFIEFGEYFLSSPEVQKSLKSMPEEARAQKLRSLRLAVGIPESRLTQLEEWDKNRTQLQLKGNSYLKEMKALQEKSELKPDEYSIELKKLKESYFGKELADEIEEEEKKGIYRFANTQEFLLQ